MKLRPQNSTQPQIFDGGYEHPWYKFLNKPNPPSQEAIEKAKFNKPTVPVFANGTGKPHSNKPADIKKVMKNHVLESVRFNEEIENIYLKDE